MQSLTKLMLSLIALALIAAPTAAASGGVSLTTPPPPGSISADGPNANAFSQVHTYDEFTMPDFVSVGTYYGGYSYDMSAQSLCAGESLNDGGFPPSSGNCVVFNYYEPQWDLMINPLYKVVSVTTMVNTGGGPDLTLEAYDASNNLLDSTTCGNNYGGPAVSCGLLGFGDYIAKVTVIGQPNYYTMDTTTFNMPSEPVPELGSIALAGLGLVGILGFALVRRKA